jgi:hypothetical protein
MYNKTSDPTYGAGASFTADLQSTGTNDVHFRFHYRDPNAKGKGNVNCSDPNQNTGDSSVCGASWSATNSYSPDPYVPVPMGTVGILGVAGLAALVFGFVQLRARRRRRGALVPT